MRERLIFHFDGDLAEGHKLNFYEASRFQYAAARWLVKLSQFRHTGKFQQKISEKSNVRIDLLVSTKGSFNINVDDHTADGATDRFKDLKLSDLIAMVGERSIPKMQDGGGHRSLQRLDATIEELTDGTKNLDELGDAERDKIQRRIAEKNRNEILTRDAVQIAGVDEGSAQRLVSMSGPLIKEMATALRRSADTFEIRQGRRGGGRPIFYLNQSLSRNVEVTTMDDHITPILANIVQFNKDTGWGKLKFDAGRIKSNFNIPYDILPRLKKVFIENMKADQVYVQAYFVRDQSGEVVRLVVVGVLPMPLP